VLGRSCECPTRLAGPCYIRVANPHEGVVLESTMLTAPLNTTFVAYRESIEGRSIWVPASLPGIRLASQAQVNVRVVPTGVAIEESVDLAHEIYNRVFREVLERIAQK
jgi:hypothetical protein